MQKKLVYLLLVMLPMTAHAWRISNHIVILEKGDKLWDVAHALFGKGFLYQKLWDNRLDKISDDPNMVYDGMGFYLDSLPFGENETGKGISEKIVNFFADSSRQLSRDTCCNTTHTVRTLDDVSFMKLLEDLAKILLPVLVAFLMKKIKGKESDAQSSIRTFVLRGLFIYYTGLILYTVASNIRYTVNVQHSTHYGSDTIVDIHIDSANHFAFSHMIIDSSARRPNKNHPIVYPDLRFPIWLIWTAYAFIVLVLLFMLWRFLFFVPDYYIRGPVRSEKEKARSYQYFVDLLLKFSELRRLGFISRARTHYLSKKLDRWLALSGSIYLWSENIEEVTRFKNEALFGFSPLSTVDSIPIIEHVKNNYFRA